jgi:hypothetical protein
MDDIVKQLVDKLNLDEGMAKQVLEVVLNAIKDKLPAPLAQQLDGLLDGNGLDLNDLGGLLGGNNKEGLGGIIGNILGGS